MQNEDADKDLFPPIYSKKQATHPLSDCKKVKIQEETANYNLIVCEVKKDEINYFDEYKVENRNQMAYDILCGTKQEANTYAYKLDKTKYHIFRFKKVLLETSGEIQSNSPFEIETLVEGTIPNEYKDQKFMGFIYLEKNSENKTYTMTCQTGKPNATNVEHNITCSIQISEGETKQYDKLYLLPYLIPYKIEKPYEVILKKTVQPGEEIKPEPQPTDPESDKGFSKHLKLSLMVLSLLVLFI